MRPSLALTVSLCLMAACGSGTADATGGDAGGADVADGGVGALSPECEAAIAGRPDGYAALDFFGKLMLGLHINYVVHRSIEELAGASDRAVVGRIVAVEEGNTYSGRRCMRGARTTTNLIFQVERELRGAGDAQIRIEWQHSPVVLTSDLAVMVPAGRMLAFVDRASRYGLPVGAPPGAFDKELFYFHTPLGLLAQNEPGLSFPLEPHMHNWINVTNETLDTLISRVAALP